MQIQKSREPIAIVQGNGTDIENGSLLTYEAEPPFRFRKFAKFRGL